MKFVIHKVTGCKDNIKKQITKLGGKIVTKIDKSIMAVISTTEAIEKMSSRIMKAKDEDIHVVSEKFVEDMANYAGRIPELIKATTICNWGSDPNTRLPSEKSDSLKSKSKSMFQKFGPSKVKLTVKDRGTVVDPDSGLEGSAHVYIKGDDKYTAILGITDIQKQKNAYYKLQLLESDKNDQYWVFRSWGRIGTDFGGKKLEPMSTVQEAISHFCRLYEKESGNLWEDRHGFIKIPGRMYPIDIEYLDEEAKMDIPAPSKLTEPVQQLINFIFDVDAMENVMFEFELDTEKMPLGKLSKKQIRTAYSVLTELQTLVDKKGSNDQFLDASNRFYTFIPHSFGTDNPPLINTPELIKQKAEMLCNLIELEIAYNLMNGSGANKGVDAYYEQLKTEIDILDRESEEFTIIQEYVKNTHGTTHNHYDLEIVHVFQIKRQDEEKRYEPSRKLHNRKLLWHGSHRTNFAGILSQGLRIAPPEAPATGYMFGKGIYFADMVSKSANYCHPYGVENTGLMLLCEVALGEMLEKGQAHYVEKLPNGKHSCKGVGMIHPDPNEIKKIGEADVPVGKPVTQDGITSSLLYNEYVVYNVAQLVVIKAGHQFQYQFW